MKNVSHYSVKWAVLTPTSGSAIKADNTLINKVTLFWRSRKEKSILIHSPNQTLLNKKIESIRGSLSKSYRVLFITDKQMSLKTENQEYKDLATKRQLLDQFIIC